ncbi:mechanosensitive ion channel domain-containing protein [uncultured Helicobacter sp.]|uniref:mechanosensitive ion channel domain-containing protein n=1 Tax=uncultured Helicobacter sp. TaxID=175537 RepID=UPI0025EC46E8|nr:mechanosensitive ion channel domain-containing protein [uncultured Helicobacter sp.]
MKRIFFLLLCCCAVLLAEKPPKQEQRQDFRITQLQKELEAIDTKFESSENVWLKHYMSLENYNEITNEITTLQKELESFHTNPPRSLTHRLETLQRQQDLLKEYAQHPYGSLLEAKNMEEIPQITNPFLILSGYSFIKQIDEQRNILVANQESLESLLELVREKYRILNQLSFVDKSVAVADKIVRIQTMLEELEGAQRILATSMDLYNQESQSTILKLKNQIKAQFLKTMYIGIAVLITILLAFLLKLTLRKYILDTDRIYTASKVINFLNITIIVLILLFAYMENVSYLVAILGFASAGLAIAMKDLFMSVLGWFVIVLGGSVHVGDRVRVCKDGSIYVGDVLDISMLRITIFEDVTLTSYMENRRAGRIIFIPNKDIFTTMFANDTHGGWKAVWDGIDFTITFDSNYKKALKIATDTGKKYAKGYTEMVRQQVHRMRDKYSLRNPNLEVRSYCMIEPNGLRISMWYQTNAYATLALRSTISGEIMEQILKEDDIHIAYPTSKVITSANDGIGNKDKKIDEANVENLALLGGAVADSKDNV